MPQHPEGEAFKGFMAADADSFIATDSVKSQPTDMWTFNTQDQASTKNENININIPPNFGMFPFLTLAVQNNWS